MTFLQPFYLWGLLTLAIPIAIHLLSRKEGKVIRVGSLRHIDQSNTSQFKSIRLNEVLLLLLRLLMISALVLFLSGAQCTSSRLGKPTPWLVVETGIEREPMAGKLIDSLVADGFQTRRLTSGFPASDQDTTSTGNYWQLAEELSKNQHRPVIVLAYNHIERFAGKRPALPRNMQWIAIDKQVNNKSYPLNAIQISSDSVRLQVAESTPRATSRLVSFVNHSPTNKWLTVPGLDSVAVESPKTIKVALQSEKGFEKDEDIIVATLNVIGEESGAVIRIEEGKPDDADWTISLTTKKPEPQPGQIYYEAESDRPLFEPTGRNRYRLTRRITNEVALNNNLVITLSAIILPGVPGDHRDHRVLHDRMTWSESNVKDHDDVTGPTDLARYLLMVFFVFWIAERIVAWLKNQ